MTPTRKTSPRTKPTTAESEPAVEIMPESGAERADEVVEARVAPTASVDSAGSSSEPAAAKPAASPKKPAASKPPASKPAASKPRASAQAGRKTGAGGAAGATSSAARTKTAGTRGASAAAGAPSAAALAGTEPASTETASSSTGTVPASDQGVSAAAESPTQPASATTSQAPQRSSRSSSAPAAASRFSADAAASSPVEPNPTELNQTEPEPEAHAPEATRPHATAPVAPAAPGPALVPLNATQLQNDPLLGTHDDIIVDLGRKLRWAAIGYALLGIVASWLIAAQVGVATKSGAPFAWALAATILIAAATVWYFIDVSTRFTSVTAYRKAKTPQAIARLDRGAVVGLYGTIGAWIGAALGALVIVSGTVTAVLTLAFGASGWAWFFGAIPVVLLYLYCFGLLHYRVLEKTRDAVA